MVRSATATKSRASTTFSSSPISISPLAVATRDIHSFGVREPSAHANSAWLSSDAFFGKYGWALSPIQVIHEVPERVPTTISGITNTDSSFSSNEKDVKRIGPVPLTFKVFTTLKVASCACHHSRASLKRFGPLTVVFAY